MSTQLASITAIVLNWCTSEASIRAAQTLLSDGVPPERLVVVDNGSGDGSVQRLRLALPDSTILSLAENVGFGRANNLGARELPSPTAYLLVNSDAFVRGAGSVARLLAALEDRSVGAAVPRLRNPSGSIQRTVYPLSTPIPELIRAAGLSRLVPQQLAPRLGAHWDHGRTRDVQGAIGAVLLVRATAWDQLGGFSERRFMYAEDHDLFWRLRGHGWRVRFVAESEFVHVAAVSSQQRWDEPGRAEQIAEAEAEMLRAHLGGMRYRVTIGAMTSGRAIRALIHRARGNAAAAAVQRAWVRGYLRQPADRRNHRQS